MTPISLGRRAFLQGGALTLWAAGTDLAAAPPPGPASSAGGPAPGLRIGLLTDLHYADKPSAGSRHYRGTPAKLAAAVERYAAEKPDFTVQLGDLIDAAEDVGTEKRWLKTIHKQFSQIPGPRRHVLGNHCVDTLTKAELLDGVGQEKSYFSFNAGGRHFIVLDSCFRADGVAYGRGNSRWDDANVPPAELDWLRSDLASTQRPTVVFAHQRLDGAGRHHVRNAAAVRDVLEASGRVSAVFQGHSHANDYRFLGGIHYATLAAMVEGAGEGDGGYAVADVQADGTIVVRGFRRQTDYEWQA
ncbi:metallophosphoesterase family protein [Alienimonas chondri]|uniref:3',5'-cyclic adenosine monophosphate phosphodiesterase CpdA n=1 Tax=Alienimonas chondri TaxID=2681879 RepID=A0ABX1VE37_9PLAN|nr:metallophosphoesterase [Alienimonas chondri]NNJ26368.1 3',5'-cyclic adenosine monophosphate phosphodiesterase CpdA [Alienimonas chondri]